MKRSAYFDKGKKAMSPSSSANRCNPHLYIPHSTELMEVVCAKCGNQNPVIKKGVPRVLWYNQKRRRYRTAAKLHSLIAPVTFQSYQQLETIRQRYKISSNTVEYHVTLAEGLLSANTTTGPTLAILRKIIQDIRTAVMLVSTNGGGDRLQVAGVNLVPTHRGGGNESLVLVELDFGSAELTKAVAALHPLCRMPQYRMHCALGVMRGGHQKMTAAELLQDLQQPECRLQLNWSRMQELGPPPPPELPDKGFEKLVHALQQQQQQQQHN